MRSRSWFHAGAVGIALACCGCVATQHDVLDLEQQTDDVKAQIADLKKTITSLQANQADLAVKMDQLHSDVNTFHETAKDSADSMSRLSAKLDDLEGALGRKVTGIGAELSKQQSEIAAQLAAQQTAAAEARKEAEKAAAAAASQPPGLLYEEAQSYLHAKEYKKAQHSFQAYLEKYPKGEMADLAMYSLGEAYYGEHSWQNGARQFALVIDRYPKSDIAPAGRLKYAICLIKMKSHLDEAKRYLESIPEDFPKSAEAASARRLLKKLSSPASSHQ